jgi:hypothetical protein
MKHVIGVSLGSSSRNKSIEIKIAGEDILIERIGTNGDIKKAIQIIKQFDGKVDSFGLGGCDLGMLVNEKYYRFHSIKQIAQCARETPLTDGVGLKNTLELKTAAFLDQNLGEIIKANGKSVLLVNAVSRWGMAKSFINAGYNCTYGDFMFSLGIPLPIHSKKSILFAAKVLCPIITRVPFQWLYPVGDLEKNRNPRFKSTFSKVSVIAGDCLYITQTLPKNLYGKIVATNTTTENDIKLFKESGISYVLTTTPVFDGRTFGTNIIEAVIIAISGKKSQLTETELEMWIRKLNLEPQIRKLQ